MQGDYTRDEMVDQILDGLENPQNLSNSVKRFYVQKYLAAAINWAHTKQYFLEASDSEMEGLSETEDIFIGTYYVDVYYDAEQELHYIYLPTAPINLPKGRGIKYIGPKTGMQNSYKPIRQNMLSASYNSIKLSNKRFYLPGIEKYMLINHPASVKSLMVKLLASVSSMKGNEKLPIPAGMDIEIMTMVRDWFIGKRQLPLTTVNNNKDEAKA